MIFFFPGRGTVFGTDTWFVCSGRVTGFSGTRMKANVRIQVPSLGYAPTPSYRTPQLPFAPTIVHRYFGLSSHVFVCCVKYCVKYVWKLWGILWDILGKWGGYWTAGT